MIIWSGWGVLVVVFIATGLFTAFAATDALQLYLPYGPAGSAAFILGGLVAAAGIMLLTRWREGGEARVLVDEATGQRIEVRRSAGSLFFIPTRYWSWIVMALATVLAIMQFNATPLYGG